MCKVGTVKAIVGEFVGTFMIVVFGCGVVMTATLFGAHPGLFEVAAVWGTGVTLAIYTTRELSCAHLNPAVSLAMAVVGRLSPRQLLTFVASQLAGAFAGATVLYALFAGSIAHYEVLHGIVRGSQHSRITASMFGEFYPAPGAVLVASVSATNAFGAEAVGTFLLVFVIFALTEKCNVGGAGPTMAPLFIGATVSAIISVLAPLTQAGLNPARDLGPRLVAYLAGWGRAALPDTHFGFLTVYVAGPLVGGVLAAVAFRAGVARLLTPSRPETTKECPSYSTNHADDVLATQAE